MERDIRGNNKITSSISLGADTRSNEKPKKPKLKDFMQYKIATQVRADAAFIRNRKK